jgi:cyclopropane-fatty-acyl-phospholipid synthase
MWYLPFLEKNIVPDFLIRNGIRKLLKQRLKEENKGNFELQHTHLMSVIEELRNSPIAIKTKEANEQHYEVPTEFYQKVLGKNLKYSSGYWKNNNVSFDQSEDDMLELTTSRAEISNGMKILELGCGWGSLSLFMAKKYPQSVFTGVSNSRTQKEFIDSEAKKRNIQNLTIITADMNVFEISEQFDRIVSVEMFEHMRNYEVLLEKVARFLKNDGKLFVHIFSHKYLTYFFDVKDDSDWMSKYFFSGGVMPSDHLLLYFPKHIQIQKHWRVNGLHYSKTSEAWLKNMDENKSTILPLFEKTYGKHQAIKWFVYWRLFFLACAELWGYNKGEEWFVSHYLFTKNV